MPRVTSAVARKKRHKKVLKQAKGYYGARSKLYRTAKNAVDRAQQYNYRDRRQRRRVFRSLWITRINAAVRQFDLSYSNFISMLNKNNIELDCKILSDLAIHNPEAFSAIVDKIRS